MQKKNMFRSLLLISLISVASTTVAPTSSPLTVPVVCYLCGNETQAVSLLDVEVQPPGVNPISCGFMEVLALGGGVTEGDCPTYQALAVASCGCAARQTCSLCPNNLSPSFPDLVLPVQDSQQLTCSQMAQLLPTLSYLDCRAIVESEVPTTCGCPGAGCTLCQSGTLPNPNQLVSIGVTETCAALEASSESLPSDQCAAMQVSGGTYCGCNNDESSACRICGSTNLLPDPSIVAITGNGADKGDVNCGQLEFEANVPGTTCDLYQSSFADICCVADSFTNPPAPSPTANAPVFTPVTNSPTVAPRTNSPTVAPLINVPVMTTVSPTIMTSAPIIFASAPSQSPTMTAPITTITQPPVGATMTSAPVTGMTGSPTFVATTATPVSIPAAQAPIIAPLFPSLTGIPTSISAEFPNAVAPTVPTSVVVELPNAIAPAPSSVIVELPNAIAVEHPVAVATNAPSGINILPSSPPSTAPVASGAPVASVAPVTSGAPVASGASVTTAPISSSSSPIPTAAKVAASTRTSAAGSFGKVYFALAAAAATFCY